MGYQTTNPYTGEVVQKFEELTEAELREVVTTADEAFRSWRTTPVADREVVLQRAADALRADKSRYAEILTLEMGKVIGEAEAEVELSADILEYYAQHAAKFLEPQPLQVKDPNAGRVYLSREPLGVIYAIEPWNFPYYQLARVAGPQLAAGNTMIVKHAENVPQAALAFEKLLADAGAPKGIYTNVFISHELSNTLIADQRVRGVALTGSERAGAAVATEAAKNLKKSTLELGGADAFIVLDDADVDKAADWAVLGRHWNAGQVCVSSKRLIVDDSVYDRFMDRYRAGVATLKAGDPMDRSTTLAPLSSDGAASRLQSQVEQAIANGAKAEQLGDPVPTQGNFFQPTILTDIAPDNPARHEEFFGPVSQVYRVSGEEEAIKVANDSPYGLGGSVFTSDPDRGERVSQQVDTGMIFVNHPTGVKADSPSAV
ncbi:aldehyde dehydrogenase family protein [Naumannella halotolerans]|uniref:aldehyde dehydrogenase family protein n=1 Tax=Naumannella halotolerans TaxID=993414 RepID=UPI001AAF6C8B|nr:aldehyde dehydrogenase family protein [Naumannella halotolerans]